MSNFVKMTLAGLALASALVSTPAFAETTMFKAALTAGDEVPATTSKGTGTLAATYDSSTKLLTWKGAYTGLSGAATAAHFHGPAAIGKSAPVEVPLTAIASPFDGKATLTDAQAKDLMAGMLYINVHTAANPNGEIRGQVVPAK
ncbi:MAG: CHRD domain-containing protein [Ancalomicrobiaceae bacterium]|nr:CHRD domain-containing protein [Ancalomicrobiaceae bacterium]